MIQTRRDEQKKQMAVYRDKYIASGLSCEPIDDAACRADMERLYTELLGRQKPVTVIMDNPLEAWIAVCFLSVMDSVRASVMASVGASVRASVWASVWASVGASVKEFIWPWLSGQFDVNIFAFYDFMLDVMGVKINPKLLHKYNIWKRTAEYGPIWPLERFCVTCRRPKAIHKKGGQLHCETGPAILYPSYDVFVLNGVRVPEWLVMTPASEITGDTILKEDNAEIRREIIRKIGVELVVRDLGAECIDKEGEYELLLLDLQDGRKRPYLKMQNPSIDAVHIEGVHPDCRTVQAALRWRNGVDEKPLVLT